MTLENIESHCFGNNPYFHVLLAENHSEPVGYALYFFSYAASAGAPILYLEDLFVEEKYQHQGIGKAILSKLAQISIEHKCCRMEWHSFAWNEKAINYYKSIGAVPRSDLMQFRLQDDNLINLAKLK